MEAAVELVLIAGVTGFSTGAVALLSKMMDERSRAKFRREDWARQDLVAAKVDEAARLAAISTDETHSQLRQIHAFVNSDLTKVLQADLDQTRVTLVVLRKLVEGPNYRPTAEDNLLIKTTQSRIYELESILSRRPSQLLEVEDEIREAREAREARD